VYKASFSQASNRWIDGDAAVQKAKSWLYNECA
jgi:hypothetical protein